MELLQTNRRTFLREAGMLAATTLLVRQSVFGDPASASTTKPQPIRLGGPAFTNTNDPEELALAHRFTTNRT